MHPGFVLFGAICVLIAGLLFFFAWEGVSFLGANAQILVALAISAIAVAAILMFLLYKAIKANLARVKTGREALIGSIGIAVSDLKPKGEVRVLSEFWHATAKDEPIMNGEEVEVVGMEGLFLIVTHLKEKA